MSYFEGEIEYIKELEKGKELPLTPENKNKWLYWLFTVPLVLTLLMAAAGCLSGSAQMVQGITHLGYPLYMLKILGTAKLLGIAAIL